MNLHETPRDVASVLARHAPRQMSKVLDPSVGHGALVYPLLPRIASNRSELFCLDINLHSLECVSENLKSLQPPATFVHSCFLKCNMFSESSLDCIVMNPPFAAKKNLLVQVEIFDSKSGDKKIKHVPVEVAFYLKATKLLRDGGRILSVLPSSIISAESMNWLRSMMLSSGEILYVHELPERTFPSVESRMYLFVFRKGGRSKNITLCNHDLKMPEKMKISWTPNEEIRFDYSYNSSINQLQLLMKTSQYNWKMLGEVATTIRGSQKSPSGNKIAIHTSDYKNGYWHGLDRHQVNTGYEKAIHNGDILMSRVGRNCSQFFGVVTNAIGVECTDCVWIIRPKQLNNARKILFSIYILSHFPMYKALLERGSGASYITAESLNRIPISLKLAENFPDAFLEFKKSIKSGNEYRAKLSTKQLAKHIESQMLSISLSSNK